MSYTYAGGARFEGKTALITGAGSGIGKATAIQMAREGANVALFDVSNERILETEREINAIREGSARAFDVDIADPVRVEKAVLEAVELFDGLHIIFANAGINGVVGPIEDLSIEDWRQTLSTNLDGTFLTVKYTIPHLKRTVAAALLLPVPLMEISALPALGCQPTAHRRRVKLVLLKWLHWSWLSFVFVSMSSIRVPFRRILMKPRRSRKG